MKAVGPFIPASVRFEKQPQQVSTDQRPTVNDEVSDDAAGVRSPNVHTLVPMTTTVQFYTNFN